MIKINLHIFFLLLVSPSCFGQIWDSVGSYSSILGEIERLEVKGDSLLILGAQLLDDQEFSFGAHVWNGELITSFGLPNTTGDFLDIEVYEDNIYVGGSFLDYAGNDSLNKIFKIGNDQQLLAVGQGSCDVTGEVKELIVYNGNLIAATSLDDIDCQETIDWMSMAKWDGEEWAPIGGVWAGGGPIPYKSLVFNNHVYVMGKIDFISQDNDFNNLTEANNIAAWDGTVWNQPSEGVNDWILDAVITEDESALYVVGLFSMASGVSCPRIAKWDGTIWSQIGSNLQGTVYSVEIYHGYIFVGGAAVLETGEHMAVYDGNEWQPISVGSPNGFVTHMEVYNDDLYVGGPFTGVVGQSFDGLARFHLEPGDCPTSVYEQNVKGKNLIGVSIRPNPGSNFEVILDRTLNGYCEILRLDGEFMFSASISNERSFEIDLSTYSSQTYLLRIIEAGNVIHVSKLHKVP